MVEKTLTHKIKIYQEIRSLSYAFQRVDIISGFTIHKNYMKDNPDAFHDHMDPIS